MAKLGVFGEAGESMKAQDSRGWSLEATEAESNQKPSLLHTNWPGFRTVWSEPSFWP